MMTEDQNTADRPRIFLRPGGDKRVGRGNPWVYSNEVRMDGEAKAVPPGTIVQLVRIDGKPLGVGTFNPHTLICFRRFAGPKTDIDRAWITATFADALDLRRRFVDVPFYRLVHAEADGLPGLIVDRFGDVLVLQSGTAGMDLLLNDMVEALDGLLSPKAIVLRNDGKGRRLENLTEDVRLLKGEIEGAVEVHENGLTFMADPMAGQKTGWFCDQRDNRAFVARLAEGRCMLDVYSYGGGFGITAAAAGATEVRVVDSSESALDLARGAAERNGVVGRCTFAKANAFAELERLAEAGRRYGVVACDPPAFVKSKKDLKAGLKGYRKLAALGARCVEPGGILFMASCSHNVEPAQFQAEVAAGLGRVGRRGRIIRAAGAAPDHPVHPQLPETAYLKALVLALD